MLLRVKRLMVAAVVFAAVAASVASASAASFVIQGDYTIGGFAVKANGTLDGAIEAFGQPTSMRRGRFRGFATGECVVRWKPLALRIHFYNLGGHDSCKRQYGYFRQALITGKEWRTSKGLRIGEPSRRLHALYSPRRFTGQWAWLLTRYTPIGVNGHYPGLEAKLLDGWVVAFRINFPAGGD
jgi:hypothetical protein